MFEQIKAFAIIVVLLSLISSEAVHSFNLSRADQKDCSYLKFQWIRCSSDSEQLDIKGEIEKIYNAIPNFYERTFTLFEWTANVKNGELPQNVFQNFRIINIAFNSANLEKIHSNAFSAMYQGTEEWKHLGTTKLRNFERTEYDLYKALEVLSELKNISISLDSDFEHQIPENAFEGNQWNQLSELVFSGNFRIGRIGSNLIRDLPITLSKVSFEGIPIEAIERNAFQMKQCVDCSEVYLGVESTQLNENKVENFEISGRSVLLHLCQS